MKHKKKVTSLDVARRAGVSRATVSYVLNKVASASISPVTQKKVLKAVEELNYIPIAAGQALASSRTGSFGLVYPVSQASNPLLLQVIQGLLDIVQKNNFRLLIDTIDKKGDDSEIPSLSRTKSIDGLVLFGTHENDKALHNQLKKQYPIVTLGESSDSEVCSIGIDSIHSAVTAVNHLISLGHRKIACITNAPLSYSSSQERFKGYKLALEENEIIFDPDRVQYGDFNEESGYRAMKKLLRKRCTACFAASDRIALGAMRAITEAGLRIPEDIAVMGFNNDPQARFFNPPLSSIRFSGIEMGIRAGEMLFDLINEKIDPGKRIMIKSELVIRESTKDLTA